MNAQCDAKKTETKLFEFPLPASIFLNKQEEDMLKVPLIEKPLSQGPSSSLSGRLYKVQYYLSFTLKHAVVGAKQKTMQEAQIPLMIMTPNKSCIIFEKSKISQHPKWSPFAFECIEFFITPESEKANEYATFRKWLI